MTCMNKKDLEEVHQFFHRHNYGSIDCKLDCAKDIPEEIGSMEGQHNEDLMWMADHSQNADHRVVIKPELTLIYRYIVFIRSKQNNDLPFHEILQNYVSQAYTDNRFSLWNSESMIRMSHHLHDLDIPDMLMCQIIKAEFDPEDLIIVTALRFFLIQMVSSSTMKLPNVFNAQDINKYIPATNPNDLYRLEEFSKVLELFRWFGLQFPNQVQTEDKITCEQMRELLSDAVTHALNHTQQISETTSSTNVQYQNACNIHDFYNRASSTNEKCAQDCTLVETLVVQISRS